MVGHVGLHMHDGLAERGLQVGIDKGTKGRHTHLSRLLEPHVAIDACTLIEPSLFKRGVRPYTDQVVTTIVNIRCDVIHLRHIAARLRTHIEAVEPYSRVTEDAIEAQHQVLAKVFFPDVECLAIPSHTGLRILPPYGLVTMRMTGLWCVGQRGHPVVGNLYLLPCAIIEFLGIRPLIVDGVSLCQVVEVLRATAKILLRIASMSEGELPTLVEADGLTYTLRIPHKKHTTGKGHEYNLSHIIHFLVISDCSCKGTKTI